MISDRFAHLRKQERPPPDPGVAVLTALLVLDERDRARSTACLLEEELARVTAERDALREALRRLVRAAGELYMEGSDGDEDEYAAAYELAEAALASPVQEESDG